IKRLVGLPGETVRIFHGDIYIKPPGGESYALARKPLRHQAAMQMVVYDDRHQPRAFQSQPEWQRWTSAEAGGVNEQFGVSRYRTKPASEQWAELRYRNLVPGPEDWDAVENGQTPSRGPRATLITDFYSYNTNMMAVRNQVPDESQVDGAWMQPHWVGDLTLQADVEVVSPAPGASLRLELVKAGI